MPADVAIYLSVGCLIVLIALHGYQPLRTHHPLSTVLTALVTVLLWPVFLLQIIRLIRLRRRRR